MTNTESGSPNFFLVIPARFASTRLPGKPLSKIGDRTMIERVVERAQQCMFEAKKRFGEKIQQTLIVVATDDQRIVDVVEKCGVRAIMTPPELCSGTDRIHRALRTLAHHLPIFDQDLVINVQGDEPFFSVDDVLALAERMLNNPNMPMGTLAFRRNSLALFMKSSVVKVVLDREGSALYFSRAPVPWPRAKLGASGSEWLKNVESSSGENAAVDFWHHLGVYAYRRKALSMFAEQLRPGTLEQTEGLEQLRALEAGLKITVVEAHEEPFGIDTPEDLEAASRRVSG